MAIFDEKMAVGKFENLATLHPHDLTQPSGQEIWGGRLNLINSFANLNKNNKPEILSAFKEWQTKLKNLKLNLLKSQRNFRVRLLLESLTFYT